VVVVVVVAEMVWAFSPELPLVLMSPASLPCEGSGCASAAELKELFAAATA
jgi:hypothetical protein